MADEAMAAPSEPIESEASSEAQTENEQQHTASDESNEEESRDSDQSSQSATASDKAPAKTTRKYKVKVDDVEEEIEEAELLRGYQKAKAGDKRLREAAQLKQGVESFLKNLKSGDHNNLVQVLGKEQARKIAESLLLEEMEYEELPEHEKTIRQLQKEKEAAQKQLDEYNRTQREAKQKEADTKAGKEIEDDMISALKDSGIKPNARLFGRMAEMMEASIVRDRKMIPAAEALKLVRNEIPRDFVAYTEGLSNEGLSDLISQLPKKFLDAVRKDAVKDVLSQTSVTQRTNVSSTPTPRRSRESQMRMSTDSAFDQIAKRLGG